MTDERRWWELQLGVKLRGGSRHPRLTVCDRPPAREARKNVERRLTLVRPVDEHRWWEMQLGRKLATDTPH